MSKPSEFIEKGYSVPSASDKYMKFQQGNNKFRILDRPIMGNEYWNHEGKPVRLKPGIEIDQEDIGEGKYGKGLPKHFWAMPVYNYAEDKIQVLEITQKSILKNIVELAHNADWGSPVEYDLTINKAGEGKETEYIVTPTPPKPVAGEVKEAWESLKQSGFDLNQLYEGGDPFAPPKESKEINIDDISL